MPGANSGCNSPGGKKKTFVRESMLVINGNEALGPIHSSSFVFAFELGAQSDASPVFPHYNWRSKKFCRVLLLSLCYVTLLVAKHDDLCGNLPI